MGCEAAPTRRAHFPKYTARHGLRRLRRRAGASSLATGWGLRPTGRLWMRELLPRVGLSLTAVGDGFRSPKGNWITSSKDNSGKIRRH